MTDKTESAASTRIPFTIRTLDALPIPTERRMTYHDATTPGLSLRVGVTGVKTFTVLKRPKNGRVERISLGRYPQISIADAQERAKVIVGKQAAGESVAEQGRQIRQQKAFGEVAEAFFKDRAAEGKRTVDLMRQAFELYLGKLPDVEPKRRARKRVKPDGAVNWQAFRPSDISPDAVRRLRADLAESCGRTTANRTMALFRSIVNFGRKHSYIDRNVAGELVDAVAMFEERPRTRRLNAEEMGRFFAALEAEPSRDFHDFLTLLLFTGARRQNVMSMRWDEIDLAAQVWEIPAAKAKAGEAMPIPLGMEALLVLSRRRKSGKVTPFVFPAASESGHMEEPKKHWLAFRARAGLADLTLHDLRRTLGSFMVDTGASLSVIGKQLGHRDAKSTAIYARLDLAPTRVALEKAERRIRATARKAAGVVNIKARG
jgi:integrase